jgi:hypothetical protein
MPMPAELGAGLSELLGLRLVRAFQNLESDWERLRVVEYVEALNNRAEAKVRSVVRSIESNIERDEQNGHAPGKII